MPLSDGIPSSPGPGASLEESLAYYKAQYEVLASELEEFQESSKALEAELERDIDASEKRERQLKEKASGLSFEVEEWKTKYKQAKAEASSAQSNLQREITTLRDTNRSLQLTLRDIEVANDDYERKQRNTESSLEDLESKYNQTIEREVMLQEQMKAGEEEREALRIDAQRLRDEFSDLKIESDITKEKLRQAEHALDGRKRPPKLQALGGSLSPRSERSPTPTTTTSSPTFDTPPAKTASSPGISDTPTPPSPPMSEKSTNAPKPFATPTIPKSRISMNVNDTTPRQSTYSSKMPQSSRGPSMAFVNGRSTPSISMRQSISKPGNLPSRQPGLPQSNSIYHLRNLRGKMQKLEERVHTARSKLPTPAETPPKVSPGGGLPVMTHVPSSVTVRSNRRRVGGSTTSGVSSVSDHEPSTPSGLRLKSSRPSIGRPTPTPTRGDMAAPPARPVSRASVSSRSSINPYMPGHSRPASRASISGLRAPLGCGIGQTFTPNASTDRVRPKSSLSNHSYDGAYDDEEIENVPVKEYSTPTPRRATLGRRTSEIGSSIPSPTKRLSVGVGSKLPTPALKRQSTGLGKSVGGADGDMKPPPSSHGKTDLAGVGEAYDAGETF
jgi:hypothetical protein